MNYRHIYHAGNFADVFKHLVLVMVLEYLKEKDKPFFVLDTHAGIGLYDLYADEAQKTGEGRDGVGRLWDREDAPQDIRSYLEVVKQSDSRNQKGLRFYPGSPVIIQKMMRLDDRFIANELHPDDNKTLWRLLSNDRRIRIENTDGYQQMRGQLPPHERRGLVLVDPPFEVEDEFERIVEGLKHAYKRWSTGIYMLWYPIKDPRRIEEFHRSLAETGIRKIMAYDFMIQTARDRDRLNGCGLILVNQPWTLQRKIELCAEWMVKNLTSGAGKISSRVIAGE